MAADCRISPCSIHVFSSIIPIDVKFFDPFVIRDGIRDARRSLDALRGPEEGSPTRKATSEREQEVVGWCDDEATCKGIWGGYEGKTCD